MVPNIAEMLEMNHQNSRGRQKRQYISYKDYKVTEIKFYNSDGTETDMDSSAFSTSSSQKTPK